MSSIKEMIAEPHDGYKNTGFLDVCNTKTEFETTFNDPRKLYVNSNWLPKCLMYSNRTVKYSNNAVSRSCYAPPTYQFSYTTIKNRPPSRKMLLISVHVYHCQ